MQNLKTSLAAQEVVGLIPGLVISDTLSPTVPTAAMIRRSCVAKACRRASALVTRFGVIPPL